MLPILSFDKAIGQCITRRNLLQVGGFGLAGLSLSRLLEAEESAGKSSIQSRADACIVIFLNGGPSHLDMWDMKPDASDGIRGEFNPIASSLPGVSVCEHMPRLAKLMHHATLIRSMNHSVNNAHAMAVYTALTGHDRGDANLNVGASVDDHPAPGSVLTLLRPPRDQVLPYVALPYMTKEGVKGPPQPGFFGGFIGRGYDPLWVLKDPNAAEFSVPELTLQTGVSPERLALRKRLLERLNGFPNSTSSSPTRSAMDRFQQRAFDVLTSRATRKAFLIEEEPDTVRKPYGRNIYGQSVLLARRLIEAGTRMVTISWAPDANATWDTHAGNFTKLKDSLLPQFDAACASLITDLAQRGMLKRTLVAVMGDFGRSPRINKGAGRDHWNYCYTIMLVGGGIKAGYVFGSSDKTGAFPVDRPVTPGDIIATTYHLLGIDHRLELHDRTGRRHRLVPNGEVVRDLLA